MNWNKPCIVIYKDYDGSIKRTRCWNKMLAFATYCDLIISLPLYPGGKVYYPPKREILHIFIIHDYYLTGPTF